MTVHGEVMSPPVLTLPWHDGKFALHTNICNVRVGRVFVQEQENRTNRPIRYSSCSVHDAQCAYDVVHCKCYAVMWKMLLLRPHSEGTMFTIRFNPDFSRRNQNMAEAIEMLVQRRPRLAEIDLDIVHKQRSETSSVRTINTRNQT